MVIRELVNLIGFKVDKGQMAQTEKDVSTFGNKLQGLIGGLAITGLITGMLKTMSDIEQLEFRFGNLFGSIEKGQDIAGKLIDTLSFKKIKELEPVIKQFIGLGDSTEDIIDQMKVFDDVTDAVGMSLADFGFNMSRARARTKLTTRELVSLNAQGIPVTVALAQSMGKTEQQIIDMGKAGKVTYKDMLKAMKLLTSEGGKFFNAGKRYSLTLEGILKGFKKLFGSIGNSIRQYVLPPLEKLLSVILGMANYLNTRLNPTMKAVIFYMLALVGIIPLLSAGIGLLNAKFLLITGVVLLVAAAIALLVEDIWLYVKGQESLIGKMLPPWEELKKKIDIVKDAIIGLWEETKPFLIDMKAGWTDFLEYVGMKLYLNTKAGTEFHNSLKWIKNDILETFTAIKQFFTWIENSKVFKWLTGGFIDSLDKGIENITPKLRKFFDLNFSSVFPKLLPATAFTGGQATAPFKQGMTTQRNINVDSTINVTLPAGTPEFHKRAVRETAKQAVFEIWNSELRNLISEQPESE